MGFQKLLWLLLAHLALLGASHYRFCRFTYNHCLHTTNIRKIAAKDPNAPVAKLRAWDTVLPDGTRTDTKFPKWKDAVGVAQAKKEAGDRSAHGEQSVVYGATAKAEEVRFCHSALLQLIVLTQKRDVFVSWHAIRTRIRTRRGLTFINKRRN